MALLGSAALLRRNNHLYTLSITISELMVGAGWFYIALYDENDTFGPLYSPRNVHTTVHGISLITVLASMIDRYLCVKYPFKYSQKMTRIKAVAIIAITWLGPIATVVLKIIFPNKKEKTFQAYSSLKSPCLVKTPPRTRTHSLFSHDMSYTLDNVALVTLNTVYATCIVLTNLLLIVALLNSSTLLRKNNYLYTLSISLSDLLVGAGWLYNGLHRNADDGNISYRSPEEVFLSIHSISMITFLGAVIDRYYAVQHPFRYVRVMTRAKVVVIIAFVWLIPLTFLSLQSLAPTNYSMASRDPKSNPVIVKLEQPLPAR
ncbi:unnamed protein product [Lampetra fluviatilis]